MKKLPIIGITLTLLLGLTLWQQQLFAAKAAPLFNNLTVTNINDSGAGSLRQAIADAASGDTIVFDATVFSTPQTITLTSGELVIDKSLTIQGPGASQLTVSGNNASRVFYISRMSPNSSVMLDGLTVTGGNGIGDSGNIEESSVGGAIFNDKTGTDGTGTLTLTNCTVSGNSATEGGGIGSHGALTVINSTVTGNSASNSGGGIFDIGLGGGTTANNTIIAGNFLSDGTEHFAKFRFR